MKLVTVSEKVFCMMNIGLSSSLLKYRLRIPFCSRTSLILVIHRQFWSKATLHESTSNLFAILLLILSQFFYRMALNSKGTLPISSNTPTFVVHLCTPRIDLHIMSRFSMGFPLCSFIHPQKSLLNNRMGFIIVSTSLSVVRISCLKELYYKC